MKFTFGNEKATVGMVEYTLTVLKEFLMEFGAKNGVIALAGLDMFAADDDESFDEEHREVFNKFIAKGSFVCERARPDT